MYCIILWEIINSTQLNNYSQGYATTVFSSFSLSLFRLFRAIQSTFRSPEKHSKRRYKICICLVTLEKLEAFRNFESFSIIFPKNSRYNLTFYESENCSNSLLRQIFDSENFRFPFFTKNSLSWGVKCAKLNFRKS